tara:strand:- start:88 stop:474 length:387 start_codon:yes stop_codon:yes gene_type:complete
MIQALLPMLQPAISKALDMIPDPAAKEKARQQMETEIQKAEGSFRDFVVAYEGRGDQVHWSIQILRGSVRPILTYVLAGAFIYGFLSRNVDSDAMEMLWQLNLLSLGFWYGERALKNLGLNMDKKKGS